MKPIALLVKDEPTATQMALRYACALLETGATPKDIFFFGRGVLHAKDDVSSEWRKLSRQNNFRLILCSASAATYGIEGDAEFVIMGLGDLIEMGLHNNRVVSFG